MEVRMEIEHLKSELRIKLEVKYLELWNTWKMLEDINWEIGELRMLMNGREDELVQATTVLKDKEKHVELNDAKQKFSQAEKIVEQIVEETR